MSAGMKKQPLVKAVNRNEPTELELRQSQDLQEFLR